MFRVRINWTESGLELRDGSRYSVYMEGGSHEPEGEAGSRREGDQA